MALTFRVGVDVKNDRFELAYVALIAFCLAMGVAKFVCSQNYISHYNLTPHCSIDLIVPRWDDASADQVYSEKSKSAHCQNTSDFEYWSGVETFQAAACMTECGMATLADSCMLSPEITVAEDAEQALFLTTQIRRTHYKQGVAQKQFLYRNAAVEAVKVRFIPNIGMFQEPFFALGSMVRPYTWVNYDATNDFKLVIVNSKKEAVSVNTPPVDDIEFTLAQMFDLMGEKDILDAPNTQMPPNVKPGAKIEYPPYWMTGVEITAHMDCWSGFSSEQIVKNPKYLDLNLLADTNLRSSDANLEGMCYLDFRREPGTSTVMRRDSQVGLDTLVQTDSYGVRLRTDFTGTYRYIDWNMLYLEVTFCVMLLRLPRRIMQVIAMSILGTLSKIYRRVLFEKVHFVRQTAAMASHMLVGSHTFVQVSRHGKPEVDLELFIMRFKEIFEGMDNQSENYYARMDAIARFAACAFQSISRGRNFVDSSSYSDAFLSSELGVKPFLRYLVVPRSIHPLERCFTPPYLHNEILRVMGTRDPEHYERTLESHIASCMDIESLQERQQNMNLARIQFMEVQSSLNEIESVRRVDGSFYLKAIEDRLALTVENSIQRITHQAEVEKGTLTAAEEFLSNIQAQVLEVLRLQHTIASQVLDT